MKATAKTAYHHGDLKDALLTASREIIEADGVEQFTLRESARRAGVSHGAPAHHFGDKTGLLTELAARALEERMALSNRYARDAGDDPLSRLQARGRAYIEYAITNKGLHDLICRTELLDWENPRLKAVHEASTRDLVETLSAATGRSLDPSKERNVTTLLAWAVVHGFSALVNERKILRDAAPAARVAAAMELAEKMLSIVGVSFLAAPEG